MDLLLRLYLFAGLIFLAVTALSLGRRSTAGMRPSALRAALCVAMLAQLPLPAVAPIAAIPPLGLRLLGVALFSAGLYATLAARLALGPELSGSQGLAPGQRLLATGVYRLARHPMLAGELALVAGFELALGSWLWVLGILLAPLALRVARAEEAALVGTLPGYREYMETTRGFLPWGPS